MDRRRQHLLRQAAALKGACGRRGLPDEIVAAMFADYQRLGSITATAAVWGRTRQATWELLSGRGYQLRPDPKALHRNRPASEKVKFEGRVFAPGKRGYLRATTGAREPLHHALWRKHHGPIPPGHQVSFQNGDFHDYRRANLFSGTAAAVTRHHQHRLHPATALLSPWERRERQKQNSLRYWRKKKAAWLAAGLRSDGRPRAEAFGEQRLGMLLSGQARTITQLIPKRQRAGALQKLRPARQRLGLRQPSAAIA